MGLLDDAIREHLELKRRHGASDEEIEQEEAEALGPARRDFPARAAEAPSDEQPDADGALEDRPAADAEPPPLAEPPVPLGKETLAETVIDEPPPPAPEPEPEPEPGRDLEDAFEPEPRHPTPDSRHPDPEPPPEEPRQDNDEDVLEETPEFLQDAPEHDRLWFEQKPPRDFDFE
jgi:hypothetical protein